MCLAAWLGASRTLTRDEIETAWMNNPDGAGFVYIHNGAPVVYRTLKLRKFIRAYETHAARGVSMAVHFRYGTHGKPGIDSVHPFRITETDWLLHNGIIDIPTDGVRSDTRTFAEDYLRKMPTRWYESAELAALVSEFVRGSKLIIATTDPAASNPYYILNAGDGYWEDDRAAWFSNKSHCDTRMPRGSTAGSQWTTAAALFGPEAAATLGDCPMCGMGRLDYGVCDACECCADCYRPLAVCDCGAPRMLNMTDAEWDEYERKGNA